MCYIQNNSKSRSYNSIIEETIGECNKDFETDDDEVFHSKLEVLVSENCNQNNINKKSGTNDDHNNGKEKQSYDNDNENFREKQPKVLTLNSKIRNRSDDLRNRSESLMF